MVDIPIMKKKPRKKKSKIYFGQPAQDAIIEYLASDNYSEKNIDSADSNIHPYHSGLKSQKNNYKTHPHYQIY